MAVPSQPLGWRYRVPVRYPGPDEQRQGRFRHYGPGPHQRLPLAGLELHRSKISLVFDGLNQRQVQSQRGRLKQPTKGRLNRRLKCIGFVSSCFHFPLFY